MRAGEHGLFANKLLRVDLSDGSVMTSRSNICATGVRWRRLGIADEEHFFGVGLFYGSGLGEAPQCAGEDIAVVGGANSAGQAAMNLSEHARKVTLLVRGPELSDRMSAYLVDRIAATANIEVRTGTVVSALVGEGRLKSVMARSADGAETRLPVSRVFVCIGGEANTEWAAANADLVRDEDGFFLTGNDLSPERLDGVWPLERRPFDLETSTPGFFAIGDVRRGSIKRVASAVGEGALAVSLVHRFLAESR